MSQQPEQIIKPPDESFRAYDTTMVRKVVPDRVDVPVGERGEAINAHFFLAFPICAAHRVLPRLTTSEK